MSVGPRLWSAVTLTTVVALALSACGARSPYRSTIALPAASEARISAMHIGTAPEAPATVSEITEASRVLDGAAATGEVGDYLLENGAVMVVIARPDGSPRAGTIVDLGRASTRTDALARMETLLAGEPIRYASLRTGTDPSTRAAFVEVVGEAAGLAATTRYELRPGLAAVLVHTSFTRPREIDASAMYAVADRIVGAPGARSRCDADLGPGQCEVMDERDGYVLDALVDEGALEESEHHGAAVVGVDPAAVPEGSYVYSRFLAPLDRPDSLAVATALAVARGEEVGEVEISLAPVPWSRARIVEPGVFWFSRATSSEGAAVALKHPGQLHPGDHVTAQVPAGGWYVEFRNDAYAATPREDARVEVSGGSRAKVKVTARRRERSTFVMP